jgi:putative long chain acyl-CoA synthase
MNRITNRRWALSAFGTASSAALGEAEHRLYSVTPLYHLSGLMMSIGGAVAGGARLAMATHTTGRRSGRRPPLRRNRGVVHVDAAARPGRGAAPAGRATSRDQAVHRLPDAARVVAARAGAFKPVRVLEFSAATEAGAILVNRSGAKIGAMKRPLPGSSDVRIAAYDAERAGSCSAPTASRSNAASTKSGWCWRGCDTRHMSPSAALDAVRWPRARRQADRDATARARA